MKEPIEPQTDYCATLADLLLDLYSELMRTHGVVLLFNRVT